MKKLRSRKCSELLIFTQMAHDSRTKTSLQVLRLNQVFFHTTVSHYRGGQIKRGCGNSIGISEVEVSVTVNGGRRDS